MATRYAENARRRGEVSPREAARILGACKRTLCRWAAAAMAGEPSPIRHVRRDRFRRYWILGADIDALAEIPTDPEP